MKIIDLRYMIYKYNLSLSPFQKTQRIARNNKREQLLNRLFRTVGLVVMEPFVMGYGEVLNTGSSRLCVVAFVEGSSNIP